MMIPQIKATAHPKKLVILFHGYGADGHNMLGLGGQWAPALPQVEFIAPNGLARCEEGGLGYQWFGLEEIEILPMRAGVQSIFSSLEAFIDQQLQERGLGYKDLALVGFSQGGMVALHMGMVLATFNKVCAGVISFAGAFLEDPTLFPPVFTYPPVLLVHGEQDDVVCVDYAYQAKEALKNLSPAVELCIIRDLFHSIDGEGLRLGEKFLSRVFKEESC